MGLVACYLLLFVRVVGCVVGLLFCGLVDLGWWVVVICALLRCLCCLGSLCCCWCL